MNRYFRQALVEGVPIRTAVRRMPDTDVGTGIQIGRRRRIDRHRKDLDPRQLTDCRGRRVVMRRPRGTVIKPQPIVDTSPAER